MREFLLNEELMDPEAFGFLENGLDKGFLPCFRVHFNDRVKLAYYPEPYASWSSLYADMSLDELTDVSKKILERAAGFFREPLISPENIIWNMDSIYLDEKMQPCFICLPAVMQEDAKEHSISAKQLYALLEEAFAPKPGGEEVCRQIAHKKETAFGDWMALRDALDHRTPEEDETITLRSVNAPAELTFQIGHEVFRIGTDPSWVEGVITGVDTVSPLHAEIGWNEINFFVKDLNSEGGTYVNDQAVAPQTEVPIGQGTVLRFADCTFTVE